MIRLRHADYPRQFALVQTKHEIISKFQVNAGNIDELIHTPVVYSNKQIIHASLCLLQVDKITNLATGLITEIGQIGRVKTKN